MKVKCVTRFNLVYNITYGKEYEVHYDCDDGVCYIVLDDGEYMLLERLDDTRFRHTCDGTLFEVVKEELTSNCNNECMIKDMPVKAQRIIAIKCSDGWHNVGFPFDRIEPSGKTISLISTMRYYGYSGEMNIDSDVIIRWE